MKIVCITCVFNEIETGCLEEFFKYNKSLFDSILIFDDGSTDGTYEFCMGHADAVIRSAKNNFKAEIQHKKELLAKADQLGADFIVPLDADEILPCTRQELEGFCKRLVENNLDAYSANYINLWRSGQYRRTDSLFGEIKPVRLWQHKAHVDPFPKPKEALHQVLYPEYVKNIEFADDFYVLHTGFMTEDRILRKFLTYRKHGQKGFELLRFIDESKLKTHQVDSSILPEDWRLEESAPEPLSIVKYISRATQMREQVLRPRYSIICLIYKDINWLQFVYKQVLKHTKMEDVEFYFVANDASEEVKQFLSDQYMPHYIFENKEEHKQEHYINNVYRAYNFGVAKAKGDFVILINSDMAFTDGWLDSLLNHYSGDNCITSRLVEQGKLATGLYGIEKNFGSDFQSYNEVDFAGYAKLLAENKVESGGLYMPLLIKKEHFEAVRGYPEGNVISGSDPFSPLISKPGDNVISGDAILMQKLQTVGIRHETAFNSIVYHFQEGEKRSQEQAQTGFILDGKVAICNDILTGSMGEKVLWDFLLELPNTVGLSFGVVDGKKSNYFQNYVTKNKVDLCLAIQNASFIDRVLVDTYTLAFLQDDLRLMGNPSAQQEFNLASADAVVTNSYYTAASYPEFDFSIVPVGIDHRLFSPKDKVEMRKKWGINTKRKVGIFVGALNDVKGWPDVKKIIDKREDIDWIVVTKLTEKLEHKNISFFARLPQEELCELLNCADFFILGSKVETQCLAAIEAALCDVPVVMHRTGIFMDMADRDLALIGAIGDDLEEGMNAVLSNEYTPRRAALNYPITIQDSMSNWKALITEHKVKADTLRFKNRVVSSAQRSRYAALKFKCEVFVRRKIAYKILKRDTFYSVSEISTAMKSLLPKPLFHFIRSIWRLIKGQN